MKIRNYLSILFAGVFLATFVLASLKSGAVSNEVGVANGFKISPVRHQITVEKGQTKTETIYVTNINETAIIAKAIINDFIASSDESGTPQIYLDEDAAASSNSFKSITNSIPNITIQPGEVAKVSVVIEVPKNAESGGYYGAIRFISATSTDTSGSQNLGLTASVGTLFLITVPGDLTERLQLVDFSAANNGDTGRVFISPKNISVITRLRNEGNIHVAPYGKIQISHNGKVIEEYDFNDESPRANILPNSIRKFEDKLKNKNWAGKYTITANFGYGTTGGLITVKSTFWAIPLWFVIIVSIAILAILAGCYFIYRRYRLRKHKVPVRR